jgi:serine/threonine-protein kinase
MIERFKRECKMAAKLSHPNIVNVHDFGFIGGTQPFLVMEFIKGSSLATLLTEGGPMPIPTVARIMLQTCSGLEEAHGAGIIHRDLKPDNILLQEKTERPDWVKLVDFGIASLLGNNQEKRLTRVGVVIGTPEYMAPEQFTGKPLDVRTDIYALGVLIFEMLTGRAPFESPAYDVLMARHLMDEVPQLNKFRPDIPENSPMDHIIAKCMAKAPAERYQTVAELKKVVETEFGNS